MNLNLMDFSTRQRYLLVTLSFSEPETDVKIQTPHKNKVKHVNMKSYVHCSREPVRVLLSPF